MSDTVTMEQFRQSVEQRLDDAVAAGEATTRAIPAPGRLPVEITSFETPAGLEITRYSGALAVSCDMSELGGDADRKIVTIDFSAGADKPPEVTETFDGERGIFSKTVSLKAHDVLATELSKYISLVL